MAPKFFEIRDYLQQHIMHVHFFHKYILFYCYLIIFKITGLAPWKVDISLIFDSDDYINNEQIYPFEISNYGFLYSAFLLITMSAYIISLYRSSLWSQMYTHTSFMRIIGKSLVIFSNLVTIIRWFFFVLRQNMIIKSLNELYSVHNIFKRSEHKFENIYSLYIIFFINLILCCVVMVVGGWTAPLLSMPCWSVPCVINSWILIQYAVILTIVNKHIKWVNEKILKLGNIDTDVNCKTLFDTKTPLGEPIIKDIINMNYVHKKLCDISQDIENFYAFPVLLGIIYFTTTTIFQLRFMIISLTTTSYGFPPTLIYADSGSWSLIALSNLVFLTVNVTKTTKEFKKTPLHVHLLLNHCKTDLKTEQTLIEFSRDLLHRNVEFSTYGIIVLDGSLLHSIFGTTVTYLIILTQFHVR